MQRALPIRRQQHAGLIGCGRAREREFLRCLVKGTVPADTVGVTDMLTLWTMLRFCRACLSRHGVVVTLAQSDAAMPRPRVRPGRPLMSLLLPSSPRRFGGLGSVP